MNATLTDKEFEQFQSLIYQQVGIKLDDQKKTMLVSRLGRRLRALKLSSFQAYLDNVNGKEGKEELTKLLDLVSTNKTDFFFGSLSISIFFGKWFFLWRRTLDLYGFGPRPPPQEKKPIRLP